MNSPIKHIYLGLPPSFKDIVLWVGREYRKNELSHKPGGSDIIVEYHNGRILGYDWIKYPSRYIEKIFRELFFNNNTTFDDYKEFEQIKIIKKEISRVYTRVYESEDFETVAFEEIWNSETDNKLPWDKIDDYIDRIKKDKDIIQPLPPLWDYEEDEDEGFSKKDWKDSYEPKEWKKIAIQKKISPDDDEDDLPF